LPKVKKKRRKDRLRLPGPLIEPFSVRRVHLEMKELDQSYFLTEQIKI